MARSTARNCSNSRSRTCPLLPSNCWSVTTRPGRARKRGRCLIAASSISRLRSAGKSRSPSGTGTAHSVSYEQLKEVCPLSPERPLALFDAEYGGGAFVKETAGVNCDLLFRLRPNRQLRLAPGSDKGRGRHPKHGAIFRLSDPTTWPAPDEEWEFEDEKLGPMKIRRWDNLHFEDAPKRVITLLRVERLKARKTRRDPGVIWLGYCGEEKLPRMSALWRQYLSRYVVEHWYRFINQSLQRWSKSAPRRPTR